MVQFLITECGASLQQDRFGLLPIHDAVENSHTEVRRYLQSQKLAEPQQSLQKRRRVDSVESLNSAVDTRQVGGVTFCCWPDTILVSTFLWKALMLDLCSPQGKG